MEQNGEEMRFIKVEHPDEYMNSESESERYVIVDLQYLLGQHRIQVWSKFWRNRPVHPPEILATQF